MGAAVIGIAAAGVFAAFSFWKRKTASSSSSSSK